MPIPIHIEKCIANTNINTFLVSAIPILGLEETANPIPNPQFYRSISHCYGQPAATDWRCLDRRK